METLRQINTTTYRDDEDFSMMTDSQLMNQETRRRG